MRKRGTKFVAALVAACLSAAPVLEAAPIVESQINGQAGSARIPAGAAAAWAGAVRTFFTSSTPNFSSMGELMRRLSFLNLGDPGVREDVLPVMREVQAAAQQLLRAQLPPPTEVREEAAEIEFLATAKKLAVLDHPILRRFLEEGQRDQVSERAPAYRERLSEAHRQRLGGDMSLIAEALRPLIDVGASELGGSSSRLQFFLVRHGEKPIEIDSAALPELLAREPDLAGALNKDGRVRLVLSLDNPLGGISHEDVPQVAGLLEGAGVRPPVEEEKIPIGWKYYEKAFQSAAVAPQAEGQTLTQLRGGLWRAAARSAALIASLALGWTILGAALGPAQPLILLGVAAAHGLVAGIGQRMADKSWLAPVRAAFLDGLFVAGGLFVGAQLGLSHPLIAAVLAAAPWIGGLAVLAMIIWELPFLGRVLAASLTRPKKGDVLMGIGTKGPPFVIGVVAWSMSMGLAHPFLLVAALTLSLALETFHGLWVNSWENFQNTIFRLRKGTYQLVFNWLYMQISGAVFRLLAWLANPEAVAPPWSWEYWKALLILSVIGTIFGTLAYRGLNALYNKGKIGRDRRANIQQGRDFIMFGSGPFFSTSNWLVFIPGFTAQQLLDSGIYLVGLRAKKRPILYGVDKTVAWTDEFKTMYLEQWTAKEEAPLKQAFKAVLYGPIIRPLLFIVRLSVRPFVRKETVAGVEFTSGVS